MTNADRLVFAIVPAAMSAVGVIMSFLIIGGVLFDDVPSPRWFFVPFSVGVSVGIWCWKNAERIEKWLEA